jgi:beta-lactamase regulating signal transducer with metallopeptidase domain/HEAT repeat protein
MMDLTLSSAVPALVLLLKATCLLVVALGASLLLQRASAGSRHLVWLVALAGLLALPVVALWAPIPLPILPQQLTADVSPVGPRLGSEQIDSRQARAALPHAASTAVPTTAAPALGPSTVPSAQTPLRLGTMLLAGWAAVAFALALFLAYGAWSVRRIVARARPLDDPDWQAPLYEIADRLELDAAPRLLRSDDVKMPFAAGLLSSTIVLPAESDGWSAERRTAVLIHELGHVRRRDLIGHTIGRVACALWWFHPLVWTAARRLRAESERACDDLALVFGARPSDYAEHLLDIVSCVRDHNTPAVALAMAHRREFEGRMLAILDPGLRRRGPGRLQTATLAGGLAALALLVGAAAPVPRAEVAVLAPATSSDRGLQVSVADTTADVAVALDSDRVLVAVRPTRAPATSSSTAKANAEARAPGRHEADTSGSRRAEVLARMLRSDSSASVRRTAAWGLHRYGDLVLAVEALAAAVAGDADPQVREMAAWSLAEAEDDAAAVSALTKALRQDKDVKVRATTVWALGEMGDASAVPALTPMLADANAETREVAAWSIGSCEPPKAPSTLVSLLGDRNRDVRLSAAWALYSIADADAADAIEAAYKRETDPEVRIGLIRALGAMGERSIDVLQRLVTSSDPQIRKTAVAELAGGGASGPWPWPRPEPRPFPDEGDDQ